MLEFQLFRIKVVRAMQRTLFGQEVAAPEVITAALESRPSARARPGQFWHVGNVTQLGPSGFYFRVGRTTRSTMPLFDESAGNFVEREFESAPYTHALVDTAIGLCGIAKKTALAPTTEGIATRLAKLLEDTEAARALGNRFEVSPISDPEEFIHSIRAAHAVVTFGITFSLPNPFDVNAQFQLPLERTLAAVRGRSGKATLKGEELDPNVLEELTRSAAATGNDAFARLYPPDQKKSVLRHLRARGATVTESVLEETQEARLAVLEKIRFVYTRIRRTTDGEA